MKKTLVVLFYFIIFLGVSIYFFKDTELFSNLNCKYALFKKNITSTQKVTKTTKKPKSKCAKFIEKAENGGYTDYNKCYRKCISLDPAQDARLYCSNGSECDAFCDEMAT